MAAAAQALALSRALSAPRGQAAADGAEDGAATPQTEGTGALRLNTWEDVDELLAARAAAGGTASTPSSACSGEGGAPANCAGSRGGAAAAAAQQEAAAEALALGTGVALLSATPQLRLPCDGVPEETSSTSQIVGQDPTASLQSHGGTAAALASTGQGAVAASADSPWPQPGLHGGGPAGAGAALQPQQARAQEAGTPPGPVLTASDELCEFGSPTVKAVREAARGFAPPPLPQEPVAAADCAIGAGAPPAAHLLPGAARPLGCGARSCMALAAPTDASAVPATVARYAGEAAAAAALLQPTEDPETWLAPPTQDGAQGAAWGGTVPAAYSGSSGPGGAPGSGLRRSGGSAGEPQTAARLGGTRPIASGDAHDERRGADEPIAAAAAWAGHGGGSGADASSHSSGLQAAIRQWLAEQPHPNQQQPPPELQQTQELPPPLACPGRALGLVNPSSRLQPPRYHAEAPGLGAAPCGAITGCWNGSQDEQQQQQQQQQQRAAAEEWERVDLASLSLAELQDVLVRGSLALTRTPAPAGGAGFVQGQQARGSFAFAAAAAGSGTRAGWGSNAGVEVDAPECWARGSSLRGGG
ncbi:hypothetical protein MNEG_0933 [Monoraphidium neglectum]|uniref:Uncharacterized protein n=1 Tax=Monoraphidium neglectum TaxID=145388 RepID=A0A0D2N3U0_9CHLO|nr:hypothetical protein MNEG_0933 [Monoraphidium neglectum]KIZ07022.1 hypothetical protein MNEG_0933 [Monoraphidium neglectum]|eukprot:XP_013906041.1 hypothetical protein MNEG_0933 [Monoraphidium neglectum]